MEDILEKFQVPFGHALAESAHRVCFAKGVRKLPHEHDSTSGIKTRPAGILSAQGPSDRRSGRRFIRTTANTDGSAMVARPGLQPRVRGTSFRLLRAVPAQAHVAAGFA